MWALGVALLPVAAGCRGPSTAENELLAPTGSVAVRRPPDARWGVDGSVPPDMDAGVGGPLEPYLRIEPLLSPQPMDEVDGHDWVAVVPVDVMALGVARVELYADAVYVGGSEAEPHHFDVVFGSVGLRTLVAIGLDARGEELARAELPVEVSATTDSSCHAMLDALGLDWAETTPRQGITDPVRLEPVINGVSFRYRGNTSPTALIMDCSLAPRLHQLTEIIRPLGMDEVIHLGIYSREPMARIFVTEDRKAEAENLIEEFTGVAPRHRKL